MSAAHEQAREVQGRDGGVGLVVVIPVYDDWDCVSLLLPRLYDTLGNDREAATFLLVDDGSRQPAPADLLRDHDVVRARTEILALRRNLGSQRAIAVALAFVHAERGEECIVVMDGDGEDDPGDVPRLLAEFRRQGGARAVFAERRRRSEQWWFVACYHLYRALHLVLTGRGVRIGNFSVLPRPLLDRLVVSPELWNHYAASVVHGRLPWTSIPTERAPRMAGRSSMNFPGLVMHGLSAISVYSELVGVRVLSAVSVTVALAFFALVAVVGVRWFTDLAVPGWATVSAGLLLIAVTQAVTISLIMVLMMLHGRQASTFLPIRDYAYFVAALRRLASLR